MERKSVMKKEKKRMNGRIAGFTLVELIVVLVILSITAAVAVPAVTGYIDDNKAKECQAQREALASEIATARMSYEVDGTEDGKSPFDVQAYINGAGDLGHCPSDIKAFYTYDEAKHLIHCEKHDDTLLAESGTFSTASVDVKEDLSKRESELPTEAPKPEPTHTYRVEIAPGPLDMETGEECDLTVTVYDENNERVPDDQIEHVTWVFPNGVVTGTESKTSASVAAQSEGTGEIQCTVTVKEENGATSTPTGSIPVNVTDPEPEPSIALEITPGSISDLGQGESRELTAKVTPQGLEGKENVEYHYKWESSDPSVTITPVGDGSTATVKGESAGGSSTVTCTVTVTYTENGETKTVTDEKTIDVKVKEDQTEAPQPELNLEVPPLTVQEGGTGKLEPKASGGSGSYTYQYRTVDPGTETEKGTVTVDEDGTVHGGKPGKAKVEVTVTDTITGETKTQEVEVEVTKSGGLFNPNEMHFWADDAASVELHKDEEFQRLMAGLPKGKWSLYSGDVSDSSFNNGEVKLHPTHYDENHCCTGPFILKYVTDDGVEDYLTVTIGYPIHTVSKPNLTNNDRTIGEEVTCNTVLEPKHTTDGPVEWEIDPASTAKVELSYLDEKCINVKIKMLSAGQFRIRAKVYRQREKDKGYVYSDWSDWDKVKYADLSQIIIPSEIDVEEGALTDIAIQTEPNDVGPLTYEYQVNSDYFEMKDGKLLGKKSTGDQRYELRVTARQEGGRTAQAVCLVKVFPRKEGETFIDGQQFKATSWEAFQKAVEANNGYRTNRKNEDDSPIFYDDIKDAGGKIIGRHLYVAIGTDNDYDTNDKQKDVKESDSFEMYISKGHNDEFVEISTPVQLAATVDWDDLGKDTTQYSKGAIVKVIHGSEVEYYIAIHKSSSNRVLGNISDIRAWWKLNILP